MSRLVAHRFGPPREVLISEDRDRPAPGVGKALVRMRLSPINPSDLIPIRGAYARRTPLPFVPGFEGVGVVEQVGPGGDLSLVGRRVLPLGAAGCWQSWKTLPCDWCVRAPDDLADEAAACAYINPLTALLMVRRLNLRGGEIIGVNAAASAIGRMLIRMIAAAGARPLAIVRSEAARDSLNDEAVEVVFEGGPLPILQGGLDAIGGGAGGHLAAAIAPGAPLLHYGLLSGQPLVSGHQAELVLFRLRDTVHAISRAAFHALMDQVFEEVRAGRATCPIAAKFPLADYRAALDHDGQAGRRGKVLLAP